MEIIKKIFIRNYKDVQNERVRTNYGIVAGGIGIFTNFIMFISKIILGFLTNSMSIIADGINNLSDMSSSIVTIFGFKMSSKPPDRHHPYGHARSEYLASFIVAIVILVVGIMLAESSIEKIISNQVTQINKITFIILIASIVLKSFQMAIYFNFGKTTSSNTLILAGKDSRNDIISTSVVILSAIIIFFAGDLPVSIDGIAGLLVSVFVIVNSITLIKDTINPLLGEQPNEELIKEIRDFIMSYKGVCGVHDLMIHNYGVNINFTTAHVEVSSKSDIVESHELMDKIENDFSDRFKGSLTIHIDPIELDNDEVNKIKSEIKSVLDSIDKDINFHDLRIRRKSDSQSVVFDLVIPYEKEITKEYILDKIEKAVNSGDKKYEFIVTLDRT